MMTDQEYRFLTNQLDWGPGAGRNQVYEFCKEFGWLAGMTLTGECILTEKGVEAVKEYQTQNRTRIDVV
jgi:hypothetical protein